MDPGSSEGERFWGNPDDRVLRSRQNSRKPGHRLASVANVGGNRCTRHTHGCRTRPSVHRSCERVRHWQGRRAVSRMRARLMPDG
jgi:hypothetical protein